MAQSLFAWVDENGLALPDLGGAPPLNAIAELAAIICQTRHALVFVGHEHRGDMRGAYGVSPFVRWGSHILSSRLGAAKRPFRGKTNGEILGQFPESARRNMACYSGVPVRAANASFSGAIWVFHDAEWAISSEQWKGLGLLSSQLEIMMKTLETEETGWVANDVAMLDSLALEFHDLKSPLSTVALEVCALQERHLVSNVGAPKLARILSAVDRMHGVIHRLVDKTERLSLSLSQWKTKKNQT